MHILKTLIHGATSECVYCEKMDSYVGLQWCQVVKMSELFKVQSENCRQSCPARLCSKKHGSGGRGLVSEAALSRTLTVLPGGRAGEKRCQEPGRLTSSPPREKGLGSLHFWHNGLAAGQAMCWSQDSISPTADDSHITSRLTSAFSSEHTHLESYLRSYLRHAQGE